jgi:Leucine rich repeat
LLAIPSQTLEKFQKIKIIATNIQSLGTMFQEGQLVNLFVLDLTNNRITTLDDNIFAAAATLKVLNLTNNVLNVISDSCFYGLVALETLDLSNNCITWLPEELFADMPHLTEVRLGDNKLQHMALDVFNKNRRFEILYLERNDINAVEAATSPLAIKQLFLQDNNLTDISGLKSIDRLNTLDLSENPNLHLEDGAFDSVPGLVELGLNNVSFGNVKSMERLFLPLSQIKQIKMARNRLPASDMKTILRLESLDSLILEESDIMSSVLENWFSDQKWFIAILKQQSYLPNLVKSSLNRLKMKIDQRTYSQKKIKNCPSIPIPTLSSHQLFSIAVIMCFILAVLASMCTAYILVHRDQPKRRNRILPKLYETQPMRKLAELDPTQSSNVEEVEISEYIEMRACPQNETS